VSGCDSTVVAVALTIDTSRPLLRPSELTALIRAVEAAQPEDEHLWIEWKSSLDLNTPVGLGHLAKAVLGFANRHPAAAARHAAGYAYLLLGVEPGCVGGVQIVDPATLVGRMHAAVGTDLRWTPEYLQVDGLNVLVVVVDPPRPGDPIYLLRKQLDKYQPGTIFVRHAGRTDQANVSDLEQLQARLLERTPSLGLNITALASTIELAPDATAAADDWAAAHERSLRSARYEAHLSGPLEMATFAVRTMIDGEEEPDARTVEQYQEQVRAYINTSKVALVARFRWLLYRHTPAMVRLRIANETDLGYRAIRLSVHLPGKVLPWPRDQRDAAKLGWPSWPQKPRPLGTPTLKANAVNHAILLSKLGQISPAAVVAAAFPRQFSTPGYAVRDSGSVDIEYDDFDLRPGEERNLPAVPILVQEGAGNVISATWKATAEGIRGRPVGQLALTVVESTIATDKLDRHHPRDENSSA